MSFSMSWGIHGLLSGSSQWKIVAGTGDKKKVNLCCQSSPRPPDFLILLSNVANQASDSTSSSLLNQKRALFKTNRRVKISLRMKFMLGGETLMQWFSKNIMHSKWTIISIFQYSSHAHAKLYIKKKVLQTKSRTDVFTHSCHGCLAGIHAKICMASNFTVCYRGWCPRSSQITSTLFGQDLIHATLVEFYYKCLDIFINTVKKCLW